MWIPLSYVNRCIFHFAAHDFVVGLDERFNCFGFDLPGGGFLVLPFNKKLFFAGCLAETQNFLRWRHNNNDKFESLLIIIIEGFLHILMVHSPYLLYEKFIQMIDFFPYFNESTLVFNLHYVLFQLRFCHFAVYHCQIYQQHYVSQWVVFYVKVRNHFEGQNPLHNLRVLSAFGRRSNLNFLNTGIIPLKHHVIAVEH